MNDQPDDDTILVDCTAARAVRLDLAERKALRFSISEMVAKLAPPEDGSIEFTPGVTEIPASAKCIGGREMQLMVEAALDGRLAGGRFTSQFEKRLARMLCTDHVLTTNSGSSANLIAVSALTSPLLGNRALKPGDEVLTVAAGFATTIAPIVQNRLVPVLVDIEIPTYNIDASLLEAALSPRIRAVVLAHTLGNPFDVDAVRRFCDRHKLWLIEDCCDALGSRYKGEQVGGFGDIGTLSFYPAHHITTGEGGAAFTRNPLLAQIMRSFRDWGRDCDCPPGCENSCGRRFDQQFGSLPFGFDHKYVYSHIGYNLKMTEMQAACGVAQLERLEDFGERRRRNFKLLSERLRGLEDYLILPEATRDADPSWFGFPLTLRHSGNDRRSLQIHLQNARIGSRLLFSGNILRQPAFQDVEHRVHRDLRITDQVASDTLWLGLHPTIDRARIDYMGDRLDEYFAHRAHA